MVPANPPFGGKEREEMQQNFPVCQRKLAALDELKKSLLRRAFSGQL